MNAKPSSSDSLKPALKGVLSNLNVHLEDELTRYRRQIRGQIPAAAPSLKVNRLQKKQLDLISIPAQTAPLPKTDNPDLPPPPPNPFLKNPPATVPAVPANPLSPASLETSVAVSSAMVSTAAPADGATGTASPSAAVSFFEDTEGFDEAASSEPNNPLAVDASDLPAEGYLESSEALLKNLAAEAIDEPVVPPSPYRPNASQTLLAPLQLGLLLLLLLGGLGVGYAIINPRVLAPLQALFQKPDPAATPSATADAPGNSAGTTGDSGFQPSGPDLSTQEFVELDLKSLSTLKVEPTVPTASTSTTLPLPNASTPSLPTSTVAPSEIAPNLPAVPVAPTPAAAPNSAADPARPSAATNANVAPNPAPNSTPPRTPSSTPTPLSTAVSGSNFYVVADYTGDPSLTKTRTVVSDAFVRNFQEGARIQVGAFDSAAAAQQHMQDLQKLGLAVRVYGPTNE